MDSYRFIADTSVEARYLRRGWYALIALICLECLATITVAALYRHDRAAWDRIVWPVMGSIGYTSRVFWLLLAGTLGYVLAARRQPQA